MQISTQKFTSKCGKCFLIVENEMPLGELHDFLMLMKGTMVDRMVQVHREEVEFIQKQLEVEQPSCASE